MIRLILLSLVISLFQGCDAPRRTRAPGNWINANSLNGPHPNTYYPNPQDNTSGTNGLATTTTTSSTTTGTTGQTASGTTSGFEHCQLTLKFHTMETGHFGICQNSLDRRIMKFLPSLSYGTSSTDRGICLIPLHRDNNGNWTYIGRPQCLATQANVPSQGTLYNDREGLTQYPVNGVAVMKYTILNDFFNWMHGYANGTQFHTRYPNNYAIIWFN